METDPYFVTQDNGAGAPIHFATTYKQLDMVGHDEINALLVLLKIHSMRLLEIRRADPALAEPGSRDQPARRQGIDATSQSGLLGQLRRLP